MKLIRDQMHEYQSRTVDFVRMNPKAFLIQGMGLGKTVSVLTAIQDLYDEMMICKCLVIAPLRVASHTWPNEVDKWQHLERMRMSVAVGKASERMAALDADADVYVINRENVQWLVDYMGKRWDFDMVVIDESTSFKNQKSKRFKKIKRLLDKIDRMVLMTGTPVPNSYLDLWPQIYLLDQGERLGRTFSGFRQCHFNQGYQHYVWTMRDGSDSLIDQAVSDLCFVLKKEDYADLPGILYMDEIVRMSDDEKALYTRMEKDMVSEIEDEDIMAVNAGVLCGKLQQLAQGRVYTEEGSHVELHTKKLEALDDLLESAGGENVLIAYSFRHDAEILKSRYKGVVDVREKGAIDKWNRGGIKIMIAHPMSAGHGLNLQHGGSIVIWFGLTWSLELWEQFNARLWRQGQEGVVRVYRVIVEGTIDEDIVSVIEGKGERQATMIDAVMRRRG